LAGLPGGLSARRGAPLQSKIPYVADRRAMESEHRRQFFQQLRVFLQKKMQSPDVRGGEIIVRAHEIGAMGRGIGMDEDEAWRTFKALKGTAWEGRYMPESRSEERGYTAARVAWVP
jgi:hypothetical protein